MEGRAAPITHALIPDPLCQFAGDVAGSVVRQEARFVSNVGHGRSLMLPVPVPEEGDSHCIAAVAFTVAGGGFEPPTFGL